MLHSSRAAMTGAYDFDIVLAGSETLAMHASVHHRRSQGGLGAIASSQESKIGNAPEIESNR